MASILSMPFVWFAIIVSIFTAVSASLVGVPLVLRRHSFIGFGLSNVAFLGLAMAAVFNIATQFNLLIIIPLTIGVSILLLATGNKKIKGDASIAMISIGTLALGYFLLNTFPVLHFTGDILEALFGSSTQMITLTPADVGISIGLAAFVIGFFIVFYNKIFAISFDTDFAKATGTKTRLFEIMLAVVIAIVVSLSMRLVGSLLTSALIIFPALSAMRIFKSFKRVVIFSAVISVACAVVGMFISLVWLVVPVGATIVLANVLVFGVCFIIGIILKRRKKPKPPSIDAKDIQV